MVTQTARIAIFTLTVLSAFSCLCSAGGTPVHIVIGHSTVFLNGPWRFHVGDDAAWADRNFDDSAWEAVDLTAAAGAHDEDVGLTRYVTGWEARGYRGYSGYAWYRMQVVVSAPLGEALLLSGPPAVDSAYQLFFNGQLLGGEGRFSGRTPTVFSIQPRVFAIPRSVADSQPAVIAVRVWMGPWDLEDPSGGGMRIAPALGEAGDIKLLYESQWLETVKGYIVEVIEAGAFVLLALMAWTLGAIENARQSYFWLCVALVLTACFRANQAIFFWGQIETVHAVEMISLVLLVPFCMAAWTLAWQSWFGVKAKWFPRAVGLLTLMYAGAQFFTRSWFHGVLPDAVRGVSAFAITCVRAAFVLLTAYIIYRAVRSGAAKRDWGMALAVMLLISVGQFAREVSALGIQGIWFPFGTGVSRTQYAYAIFDVVFFGLLLHRFLAGVKLQSIATEVRA